MKPQDVHDRLAIRDVIDRYSDAVTRRDWAEVAATFHDDAVWSAGAPFNLEHTTRDVIRSRLQAGVEALDFLIQMTHSVVIKLEGERATARTIIHEMGRNAALQSGLLLGGVYNDVLSRREGRWAFDRRHFEPLYLDNAWLGGQVFSDGAP